MAHASFTEHEETEEMARNIVVPDESLVEDYYSFRQQLDGLASELKTIITHPSYSLSFVQSGRLIKVKYGARDFG